MCTSRESQQLVAEKLNERSSGTRRRPCVKRASAVLVVVVVVESRSGRAGARVEKRAGCADGRGGGCARCSRNVQSGRVGGRKKWALSVCVAQEKRVEAGKKEVGASSLLVVTRYSLLWCAARGGGLDTGTAGNATAPTALPALRAAPRHPRPGPPFLSLGALLSERTLQNSAEEKSARPRGDLTRCAS